MIYLLQACVARHRSPMKPNGQEWACIRAGIDLRESMRETLAKSVRALCLPTPEWPCSGQNLLPTRTLWQPRPSSLAYWSLVSNLLPPNEEEVSLIPQLVSREVCRANQQVYCLMFVGLKYPSMIHCQFSGSIIFMSFTSELINDLVADMYEQETRSR